MQSLNHQQQTPLESIHIDYIDSPIRVSPSSIYRYLARTRKTH